MEPANTSHRASRMSATQAQRLSMRPSPSNNVARMSVTRERVISGPPTSLRTPGSERLPATQSHSRPHGPTSPSDHMARMMDTQCRMASHTLGASRSPSTATTPRTQYQTPSYRLGALSGPAAQMADTRAQAASRRCGSLTTPTSKRLSSSLGKRPLYMTQFDDPGSTSDVNKRVVRQRMTFDKVHTGNGPCSEC